MQLDLAGIERLHRWVRDAQDPAIRGLLFCRCRKMLDPRHLRTDRRLTTSWGLTLIPRRDYHQIWIHQFIRAGFLRRMFLSFPERSYRAKEMDFFTGQDPRSVTPVREIPGGELLYVTQRNLAVFGESTSEGRVTRNCRESMLRAGLALPELETVDHTIYLGDPSAGEAETESDDLRA